MEGLLRLVVLSVVMLLGSYLSGSIPLFMSLSEEKLQVSESYLLSQVFPNHGGIPAPGGALRGDAAGLLPLQLHSSLHVLVRREAPGKVDHLSVINIGAVPGTLFIYYLFSLTIHTLFFRGMFSCWVFFLPELGK